MQAPNVEPTPGVPGPWRGVTRRATVIALAVAVVLSALIASFTGTVWIEFALHRSARYLVESFDPEALNDCEKDPAGWSMRPTQEIRFTAFDLATGESRHPNAPAIDAERLAELQDEQWTSRLEVPNGFTLYMHGSPTGPCSGIAATMRFLDARRRRAALLEVGGLIFLFSTLAVLMAVGLIVWPLLKRFRRVYEAASGVGQAEAYRSAEDAGNDEIGWLATLLDAAHQRIRSDAADLEESHRRLRDHLIEVNHALKTPIASLQLSLEQARAHEVPAEVGPYLQQALEDAVYMTSLTDNLRLITQMDHNLTEGHGATRFDLREIVRGVVTRADILGELRGLDVQSALPESPTWVEADPFLLEQAIGNVTYNAVSHNQRGAKVSVTLDRTQDTFRLEVIDDGLGVDPAEIPRLFERGFRGARASEVDPRGSGLGLAITHEIASRFGMTLDVSNVEPRGFRVILTGVCHAEGEAGRRD